MAQPQYSIEARSLSLIGGVASHNFWVLRDEKGNAVAELHGLATDRKTGKSIPIGSDANQHSLRGWQFIHDPEYARNFGSRATSASYIKEGQDSQTVITGDKTEILERWKAAAKYGVNAMNARNLNYPPGGVDFPIKVDGTYNVRLGDSTVNSNSTYSTFGRLMGVTPYEFPGKLQPGINNQTLNDSTIFNLQYRGKAEFRQGSDPNGGDGIQVAAAGKDLQSNRYYQQAALAVQAAPNLPQIPQERLEQFIANVASASQQPPTFAGQPQPALDKIAALAVSTNGQDVILSNQPFSASNTGKHVSVPLQQLIEQPLPVAQRQLQDAEQRQIAAAPVSAPANTVALSETQIPSLRTV